MTTTYSDLSDFEPDEVLEELGASFNYHRDEARKASARLQAAVIDAAAAGVSESEIARFAGVTRMTVRTWLGK